MLCVNLTEYNRLCAPTTGGVSDIKVFDPDDFNFVLEKNDNGTVKGYSAVTLRPKADPKKGANMFPVDFQRKEAEYKFTETRNGCSVKYEHTLTAQLPELSQELTNFLMQLDSAGCCCGLGLIVRFNSGKIFVLGEKYVNDKSVPYFEVVMDGTEGGSGKNREDFNGTNVQFKGEYGRSLYEFIGDYEIIEGFSPEKSKQPTLQNEPLKEPQPDSKNSPKK